MEKPGLSDNDIEGHLLGVFYLKTVSRKNAKKKYRFCDLSQIHCTLCFTLFKDSIRKLTMKFNIYKSDINTSVI